MNHVYLYLFGGAMRAGGPAIRLVPPPPRAARLKVEPPPAFLAVDGAPIGAFACLGLASALGAA